MLPVAVYRFSHALVRDVAYGSLPLTQRRSLHAAMVDAIEADGGDGEAAVERLAFHALRGELGERAVEYATQVADKAIERSVYRDAAVFLRDALNAQEVFSQD